MYETRQQTNKKEYEIELEGNKLFQDSADKIVEESFQQWESLCYTRDDITAIVVGIIGPSNQN